MKKNLPIFSEIKKKHIEVPYSKIVDVYHEKHFDEKIFEALISEFVKMLPINAKVLDVGCGTGGETKKLMEKGINVIGIDLVRKMLDKATKEVPDGNFQKMDLMDLNLPDSQFDGIWSARTLIHVPTGQLNKAISEFRRVLKIGGAVCITVLGGDFEGIEPEYYDNTNSTTTFFKYFHEGELEQKLKEQDFKIIKTTTSFREGEDEPHITVFATK